MGDLSALDSKSDRKSGSQNLCKKKKKKNVHRISGAENGTTNKDTPKDDGVLDHENGPEVEVDDPALIAAETKKAKNSHNQNGKSKRFDIVKINKKSTKGRELKKNVPDDSNKTREAAKVDKIDLHDNTNDISNTASDSTPRIKYTIVVSLPSVDLSEPAKTPTKSYNATDSEPELHGDIEFAEDKQPAFNSRASTPVAVENHRTPIFSKSFGSLRSKTIDNDTDDSKDSMKTILCSRSFVKEAEKKSTCYTNKTFSRADVLESLLKIVTPITVQKKTPSDMRKNKQPENKKMFLNKLERKTSKSKRRPKSIQRLVHEARGTSSRSKINGEKKTLKSDTSKTKKKSKNPTGAKKGGSASEEEVIDLLKSESC